MIYRTGGHFEKEEEHFVFKCQDLHSNVLFINVLERALIAHFCSQNCDTIPFRTFLSVLSGLMTS